MRQPRPYRVRQQTSGGAPATYEHSYFRSLEGAFGYAERAVLGCLPYKIFARIDERDIDTVGKQARSWKLIRTITWDPVTCQLEDTDSEGNPI